MRLNVNEIKEINQYLIQRLKQKRFNVSGNFSSGIIKQVEKFGLKCLPGICHTRGDSRNDYNFICLLSGNHQPNDLGYYRHLNTVNKYREPNRYNVDMRNYKERIDVFVDELNKDFFKVRNQYFSEDLVEETQEVDAELTSINTDEIKQVELDGWRREQITKAKTYGLEVEISKDVSPHKQSAIWYSSEEIIKIRRKNGIFTNELVWYVDGLVFMTSGGDRIDKDTLDSLYIETEEELEDFIDEINDSETNRIIEHYYDNFLAKHQIYMDGMEILQDSYTLNLDDDLSELMETVLDFSHEYFYPQLTIDNLLEFDLIRDYFDEVDETYLATYKPKVIEDYSEQDATLVVKELPPIFSNPIMEMALEHLEIDGSEVSQDDGDLLNMDADTAYSYIWLKLEDDSEYAIMDDDTAEEEMVERSISLLEDNDNLEYDYVNGPLKDFLNEDFIKEYVIKAITKFNVEVYGEDEQIAADMAADIVEQNLYSAIEEYIGINDFIDYLYDNIHEALDLQEYSRYLYAFTGRGDWLAPFDGQEIYLGEYKGRNYYMYRYN